MSVTTSRPAPPAPGRLGVAVEPAELLTYLSELGRWRDERRAELDELDRAALAAPGPAAETAGLTNDITLAMALWQAVAGRYEQLERVWDSGRVGEVERLQLSALVWGRLDAGASGAPAALSVPEACRLCDALAHQLRLRLSLDPVGLDLAAHLRTLRAAVERVRDLLVAEPAGPAREEAAARWDRLDARLRDVVDRAQRGADVGGLVGSLEADAARLERDLIVGAATRRDDARDRSRAEDLRQALRARCARASEQAARCVQQVQPAPRLAVPQVDALGPVPTAPDAVDAYLHRLDRVQQALTHVEGSYAAALAERDELRSRLAAYQAKASGTGRAAHPEVSGLYRLALDVVGAVPTDLARARAVVAAYQTLLGSAPGPAPSGRSS